MLALIFKKLKKKNMQKMASDKNNTPVSQKNSGTECKPDFLL